MIETSSAWRVLKLFVIFIICLGCNSHLSAQSILPVNEPFYQTRTIEFNYSGGTRSPTDWIGIYRHGQVPGNIASTVWQYISSPTGTVFFDANLDTGRYDIHLFCCDGYKILASYLNFEIQTLNVKSQWTYYRTTDSLRFSIRQFAKDDQIVLFSSTSFVNGKLQTGAVPIYSKTLSSSMLSGQVVFPPYDSPGKYVSLQLDAVGKIKSTDAIEIKRKKALPQVVTKIGIGSCSHQNTPQPVLNQILKQDIDAFIYLGDNVYIDTYDTLQLALAYESMLTKRIETQHLRSSVPILATWDDHDYGCCDEDVDYPYKSQSQKIFLDHYEEPVNSPRRQHPGIYTSYLIGPTGQKLQIILLDTRYFLDNKRRNNGCGKNDYCPWAGPSDVNKTILGVEQWAWLKEQLKVKADLRLMVSSVQFSSSYHGFEGWSLFPYEKKRMLELITETRAEHVFFASGDMHYSEVSKYAPDSTIYPIYDFTASGINLSWPPEANLFRVDQKSYGQPNIGLINIDWNAKKLTFATLDVEGRSIFSHTIPMTELEFNKGTSVHATSSPVVTTKIRQIPMPGYHSAHLYFDHPFTGSVMVYNQNGSLLSIYDMVNSLEIHILGLNPGLYLVKVQTLKGHLVKKILIV